MGKLSLAEVRYWVSEADSCIKRQKRELIARNSYPLLINYYEGFWKIDPINTQVNNKTQLSLINEYFPNTNQLISEIMYKNPDFLAEARKPEAEEGEELMKSALTYLMEKTDSLVENRIGLFDMFYAGYCAIETDHIIERGNAVNLPEDKEPGFMQKVVNKIKGVDTQKEAEEKLGRETARKEESFATNEHTYIRRWNPLDVPLDWKAERLKDRRYNLKIIRMTKAEFDAKYPAFKNKVQAGDISLANAAESHHDMHKRTVVLYEFQIKKKNNVYTNLVISSTYQLEEIDMFDRPYVTNGFNMKIGTLHKYGKLYPISTAQVNKSMQDEMEDYIRFTLDVAKRNVPKFVTDKKRVLTDAKEALRSRAVNDLVEVDGRTDGAVTPLKPTTISVDNDKLFSLFQSQKEKTWGVSSQRLGKTSGAEFATELEIQEAGFQSKQIDIQEGLRRLITEEMETGKDIIASFWDGEYYFKVTSGPKPAWYASNVAQNPLNGQPMVLNPLTDVLTGDYFIKVDIATALRPNKARQKKETIEYLTWLVQVAYPVILLPQGFSVSVEEIKKSAKDFGFNPDTLIVQANPQEKQLFQQQTQEAQAK